MLAAAVDNTIGPLSFLIAPVNVTRHLEMKYSQPATLETAFISVDAELVERQERQLFFKAVVMDREGQTLARAKATHWII